METVSKIVLIGLLGTVLSIILKKDMPVFSLIIALLTGTIIFFLISDMLSYSMMIIRSLFDKANIDDELLTSVLKISAVGIVAEYFGSAIKDAGEEGIAKKIELGAKTVIFTMMIPIVVQVLDSIWSII